MTAVGAITLDGKATRDEIFVDLKRAGGGADRRGPDSRAGHDPGRRRPRLAGLRARQARRLREGRHQLDPPRPARRHQPGRRSTRPSTSSTPTRSAPATSFSCRCPSTSTRTPRWSASTRARTPTGCTRPTSAGWCSTSRRRCRARRAASCTCCGGSRSRSPGAHVVVIGRGVTVGRPLGLLLTRRSENATVTLCHTGTRAPAAADPAGRHHRRRGRGAAHGHRRDGRPGAAVVDVGVSRDDAGKLVGDVHPDVWDVAGHVSPNPGGVGPLTRAFLLTNVVERAEAAMSACAKSRRQR